MTIEKFEPAIFTDVDGNEIRFYVSLDGTEVGVSKRGLAVLCGVSESVFSDSRREWGVFFGANNPLAKDTPDCLKSLLAQGLDPLANSQDVVKIITHPYAIAIIKEYAINRGSKKAMLSLTAFAERGFVGWVKEITGHHESGKDSKAIETLLEMMSELKSEVLSIKRMNSNTIAVFENMPTIQQSTQMLSLGSKPFTLTDWLEANEIKIDDSDHRRLRLRVAESFKTLTGRLPRKIKTYGKTPSGNPTNTSQYLYQVEHDGMIRAALYKIVNNTI
jgi:hypothetical protein